MGIILLLLSLFAVSCHTKAAIPSNGKEFFSIKEGFDYLEHYGYVEKIPSAENIFDPETAKKVELYESVKSFQERVGLRTTGVIDRSTKVVMNSARCGVGNVPKVRVETSDEIKRALRKKRYSVVSVWPTRKLSYNIQRNTRDLHSSVVERVLKEAFKIWEDASGLQFTRAANWQKADISVSFLTKEHGDEMAFDGKGRVLGHATFPSGGSIHLDDDETWTDRSNDGVNLFQVLAHELGHALGLEHSGVRSALMFEIYRGWRPGFKLDNDDIKGITALYGPSTKTVNEKKYGSPTTAHPRHFIPKTTVYSEIPDACNIIRWDAQVTTRNKKTFLFKGNYYFEILPNDPIKSRIPKMISQGFPTLVGPIEAAATLPSGHTFFFKNKSIRIFVDQTPVDYKFRTIGSVFGPTFPSNVDAAWVWNSILYVSKGENYWRYGARQRKYPRRLSQGWRFAPSKPESADYNKIVTFTQNGEVIRQGLGKEKISWLYFKCDGSKSQGFRNLRSEDSELEGELPTESSLEDQAKADAIAQKVLKETLALIHPLDFNTIVSSAEKPFISFAISISFLLSFCQLFL